METAAYTVKAIDPGVQQHADGSVVVRASVFGENSGCSAGEVAAIDGVAAELRYADSKSIGVVRVVRVTTPHWYEVIDKLRH